MCTQLSKQPTLKELVQQLISCYQPVAERQNSLFTEDVHGQMEIHDCFEVVATLLGSLFYIVARCSNDTKIHITAAEGGGITEIVLHASNSSSAYVIINQFEHLRILSHKLGGVFHITGNSESSKIVFSFENKAATIDWRNMLKAS